MIRIDSSTGGQSLRTALGFATLLQKSCCIYNIRKTKPNPGLAEQHLQGLNLITSICNARVAGNYKKSQEVKFYPGQVQKKELEVKIGTAGSIGLIIQLLLIPAFEHNFKINFEGGATYSEWAPPLPFLSIVLNSLLKQIGMKIKINILKHGFYPRGGAKVKISITKASYIPQEGFNILSLGTPKHIRGISIASKGLQGKNVAERQRDGAEPLLKKIGLPYSDIKISYVNTFGNGCGIFLYCEYEEGITGSSAFGRVGRWAQDIGEEAARILVEDYQSGGIDRYASDQILPFLALTGGQIRVCRITEHIKNNIEVIEQFLPRVKFNVEKNIIRIKKIKK